MGRLHVPFTALAATAACALVLPAVSDAKVRTGPSGAAFYTAPVSSGAHGSVVWARKQTGADALKSASSDTLVLYRSKGASGKTVLVSGSVALPKGKMPKGGWPILTWAHGTTGIADQCAPTRATGADAAYTSYAYPTLNRFLKAGYAVVRTDYEGLGTPGTHPYLDGLSEGHSVLDIARAARKLDPSKLSKTLVISGHSQGGQAALFAASQVRSYTPELKTLATVAFAPVSHLSEQAGLISALTTPGGLSGLVSMILRGADTVAPAAGVPAKLSPQAAALYSQTLTKCLGELGAADSFGALAPSQILAQGADVAPIQTAIDKAMDPENLTVHGSVRIEQGLGDSTVFPMFTDQLQKTLKAKDSSLTYKTYPGVDHAGVVTKGASDAISYLAKRK